jgi:hypothetical protein
VLLHFLWWTVRSMRAEYAARAGEGTAAGQARAER